MISYVTPIRGRDAGRTGWINGDFLNLNKSVSKVRVYWNADATQFSVVRIDNLNACLSLSDLPGFFTLPQIPTIIENTSGDEKPKG